MRIEEIQSKTILNPTGGFLATFTHSLNAYQGCAFGRNGCPYCYVRAMPIQRFAGEPWGDWVRAKTNAPELLAKELERAKRDGKFGMLRIFMSTATDPYQGLETRLRLTGRLLEVFEESGDFGWLVVQTRSPLVERDIETLARLGHRVMVSVTVETDRDEVRKVISPTSASIERRLETLRRLTESGIDTQAAISPILPCDPVNFAELISTRAKRAVVDTLLAGDGASGKRSKGLGMAEILASAGYRGWMEGDTHLQLLDQLRARMGDERVGFSQDGFNLVKD
ncbi:MAG: radical SAM protein [Acidobacteriota bacterium]